MAELNSVTIIRTMVNMFLLMTPFVVLSVFVSLTDQMTIKARHRLAIRTTLAILIICTIIYLFGDVIFEYLGITLDAFRIGAGLVLLLSGIELVRGTGGVRSMNTDDEGDLSVVPLAIPCTVGPGTIGALLVMGAGAETPMVRIVELIGILFAGVFIGVVLYFSAAIERLVKRKGLTILSKLTGLFLAALASEIIFIGIRNFLHLE